MSVCPEAPLAPPFSTPPTTLLPGSCSHAARRTLSKLLAAISKGSGDIPVMELSVHKYCPRLHWERLSGGVSVL